MKSQTGARYLHKLKVRKDPTFTGIINISNCIRLSSGNLKRIKSKEQHHANMYLLS